MQTSVAGFVALELLDERGAPSPGFELTNADLLKGGAVDAVASWGRGATASLSALAGHSVAIRASLADSKLFSLKLRCAPAADVLATVARLDVSSMKSDASLGFLSPRW